MSSQPTPIRRVVAGNNEEGKSRIESDGLTPNLSTSVFQHGTNITDIWVYDEYPLDVNQPASVGDRPFHFEPPRRGGVFRLVECAGKEQGYDPIVDSSTVPLHPPVMDSGGTWERGGKNQFTTRIHKSATLDYGLMVSGHRTLLLDDGEYEVEPGDVVIQLASWHAWANPVSDSLMAFVMMGALFDKEPV